jgi:hypothetical protein
MSPVPAVINLGGLVKRFVARNGREKKYELSMTSEKA